MYALPALIDRVFAIFGLTFSSPDCPWPNKFRWRHEIYDVFNTRCSRIFLLGSNAERMEIFTRKRLSIPPAALRVHYRCL